jgi:two-component system phosphate regulon sensor histidine kinase PhoR
MKPDYNITIPTDNVKIVTDRDAIKQVMLNLIDNAVKYASDGKTIDISMEIGEKNCKLNVSDRGPGIPKDHREQIFEKFHRVDNSLTSQKQGAGLGLSIAKNIVQDLGGSIIYKPRDGGGSSFIIILPLTGDFKNE